MPPQTGDDLHHPGKGDGVRYPAGSHDTTLPRIEDAQAVPSRNDNLMAVFPATYYLLFKG